ncbi:MAG TPA: hypothetical protein VD884_20960 [Ohtaekwangia sp.]|nr:hypothetical protein [Ohtaekwangia sp.]
MKRIFYMLTVVVCVLVVFMGFDFHNANASPDANPTLKKCLGYEVIEAGLGINCNGDTIRLTKKHGFFQVERETKN